MVVVSYSQHASCARAVCVTMTDRCMGGSIVDCAHTRCLLTRACVWVRVYVVTMIQPPSAPDSAITTTTTCTQTRSWFRVVRCGGGLGGCLGHNDQPTCFHRSSPLRANGVKYVYYPIPPLFCSKLNQLILIVMLRNLRQYRHAINDCD